jgi:hypothetical protein
MKRGWTILAIICFIIAGVSIGFPTYTHRYRLTVDIDTPDGVRSGSSVFEVARKDVRWILIAQGRYEFRVRGAAAFVDLGNGRNVVALLATGRTAQNTDQIVSLGIEAYGHYKWDEDAWAGRLQMSGPVELKPPLVPTMVTLSDTADERTARVIYATETRETNDGRTGSRRTPTVAVDDFTNVFGEGVGLRSVRIESVSEGLWPLNLFGLSGTPITRDIADRLPFLKSDRVMARGTSYTGMPGRFDPHTHLFFREQ